MLDYHWVSSFSRLAPPAFSVAKRRCRHSAPRDMSIITICELRLGLVAGIRLCLMQDNLSLPDIAEKLIMSPATLKRCLAEMDLNFAQLADTCR